MFIQIFKGTKKMNNKTFIKKCILQCLIHFTALSMEQINSLHGAGTVSPNTQEHKSLVINKKSLNF